MLQKETLKVQHKSEKQTIHSCNLQVVNNHSQVAALYAPTHSHLGQFILANPPTCKVLGGGKKPENPELGSAGATRQQRYISGHVPTGALQQQSQSRNYYFHNVP